jgi:MoaD family protein
LETPPEKNRKKQMKIRVKSFLTVRKVMNGQAFLEIEAEKLTLRELLANLCNRFGKDFKNMLFYSKMGAENENVKILINGRHYRQLPDQMDNELKNGDEVCLFPPMAGG